MAIKEIEEMYSELDRLKNYKETRGEILQHYDALQERIERAVQDVIDGFNKGIEAGRKLTAFVRNNADGEYSIEDFETQQAEIFLDVSNAERLKADGLTTLSSYAQILGTTDPAKTHKDARDFARHLVGEYDSFGHAYSKAYAQALDQGTSFVISEHAPHSIALMKMANESVERARVAMRENSIPKDLFRGVDKISKIGDGKYFVQECIGGAHLNDPWEQVNGAMEVIRKDTGRKDTLFVPAIYVPSIDRYYILDHDFKKHITSIGEPIARMDVSKSGHPDDPGEFDINNAISILAQYGYSGKNQDKEIRQWLLKTVLDEKIMNKIQMKKYFDFRVNTSKSERSKLHDQYPVLCQDREFVLDYVPEAERETAIDSIEIKARNGESSLDDR